MKLIRLLLGSVLVVGCASRGSNPASSTALPAGAEAMSLLKKPLYAPSLSAETRASYERRLSEARIAFDASPNDAEAIIWLGRRNAYLGQYRESIKVFTEGIAKHPTDARLYRHRGHRYLTVRQFDDAIADFNRAAELIKGKPDEIEPDGLPNARNIPTSTLQSNIWYHLGLAHYLKGDFERALEAYREAMKVSTNPDMLVATTNWLYMTLRRLDRFQEAAAVLAPITRDMNLIENDSYHRLLLVYKGEIPAESAVASSSSEDRALDDATLGYGIGNWHLYRGFRPQAERIFKRVLEGKSWAAFGYIAAEAEMARR
ncbi:MAG: tetratricopeptide repeat protein [Gemmatimonadota bacterium]|nr:tetratricopeptide repeat protein [Gemmatimonadota bacterium]